jgi:fructose-bisphosphate aldolase, class I
LVKISAFPLVSALKPRNFFNIFPMDNALLAKTAAAMVAKGKGILAADESSGTCEKRFKSVNVECTEENRRAYRNLLFSTPGIEQYLSGVILFDETARQKAPDGAPIPEYLARKGIVPGIKVDKGTVQLSLAKPGELVTEGLDGLSKRLDEYFKMGCRFAKWRAVITIGQDMPSAACIHANAEVLARYAAACQAAGIVPMIEPEVLLDGSHTVERSEDVHKATLEETYEAVARYNVAVEYLILKTSMVVSGKENARQAGVDEVAERTVRVLKNVVPAKQPGIVFLSGGQSDEAATAHLNAMAATRGLAWPLTFSYSRALQNPALKAWKGQAGNVAAAQKAFHHRAQMNALAAQGKWKNELERQAA